LEGRLRARVLVDGELHRGLLLLDLDRGDLVLEPALLVRRRPTLLARERVLVAVLARDAVLLREVLRGDRHRRVAVAVRERGPQRVLDLRRLPERPALAPAAEDVRRLGHVLGAADEDDL